MCVFVSALGACAANATASPPLAARERVACVSAEFGPALPRAVLPGENRHVSLPAPAPRQQALAADVPAFVPRGW